MVAWFRDIWTYQNDLCCIINLKSFGLMMHATSKTDDEDALDVIIICRDVYVWKEIYKSGSKAHISTQSN